MNNTEPDLHWVEQAESLGAVADLDRSFTLLREVASGTAPARLVRIYRPQPTVSFGARDVRLPGYNEAVDRCHDLGFTPAVRRSGGQAAAYHQGCLVVDHFQAQTDGMFGFRDRFASFGQLYAEVFQQLGIDAGVGEIPGEYCPGEFSVHGTALPYGTAATGRDSSGNASASQATADLAATETTEPRKIKLVGTSQRVIKGAWLFSSSVVITNPEPLKAVTSAVYDALGLPLDPATVGAASELNPNITVEQVLAELKRRSGISSSDPETSALSRNLLQRTAE